MKRVIALVLALAPCALLADECSQQSYPMVALGKETMTVSTTALLFTETTYNPGGGGGAIKALITTENDTVRFWTDGTAPTSALGHLLAAGSSVEICGAQNIRNFKVIRAGSSDATVQVSYYRPIQ